MNTPVRTAPSRRSRKSWLAPVLACIATLAGLPVHATVSFPDVPMQTNQGVPPNIWFILDDSGSMGDTKMPDTVPGTTPNPNIALQTYTRNTIYYNPSRSYLPWQGADGTYLTDTPYNAVWGNTDLLTNVTDLNTATQTFYVPNVGITNYGDTTQYTRYQFLTNGTATVCTWKFTATIGFNTCINNVTTFTWPGGIVRTLAQEKQNFATWYSFHRTRIKVAKAGASYAFNDTSIFNADNDYRVGFTTIWQTNEFRIPVGNNG
ncbi:MAG: hypothetical protein ACTHOH_11765, partial [Lysobacteraceae bacterium]